LTGPEHYRAAEELLTAVATGAGSSAENAEAVAMAQAHATLALAAATALGALAGEPEQKPLGSAWPAVIEG
jgi:hypothetical protein